MNALEKAINHIGNQTELARALNTSQARVWNWLHRDSTIPAEFAVPIEKATNGKVTRYDLRPDIFGKPPKRRKKAAWISIPPIVRRPSFTYPHLRAAILAGGLSPGIFFSKYWHNMSKTTQQEIPKSGFLKHLKDGLLEASLPNVQSNFSMSIYRVPKDHKRDWTQNPVSEDCGNLDEIEDGYMCVPRCSHQLNFED